MKPRSCERVDVAEAHEDGRLDAEQRADFERHAESCAVCAGELAALGALRETMRTVPLLEAPPGVVRSERDALLARIQRGRAGGARSNRQHAWLMFAAAALAILAFLTERLLTRPSSEPPRETMAHDAPAPRFDVASVREAVWQSNVEGGTVRGTLTSGVASFHVEHLGAGQRFLLSLPDGDLEVRGTRFTVHVHDGVTEEVDVTEGVVALHLRDRGEVVLRAGERWPSAALSGTQQAEPELPPAPATPAPVLLPTLLPTASKGVAGSPSPRPEPPELDGGRGVATASERFVEAMAAFKAGAYERADALLAAFAADFPTDLRREDAAFLRAVARARMGDQAGAAARAREYLRLYPAGLRAQDARRLADGPTL